MIVGKLWHICCLSLLPVIVTQGTFLLLIALISLLTGGLVYKFVGLDGNFLKQLGDLPFPAQPARVTLIHHLDFIFCLVTETFLDPNGNPLPGKTGSLYVLAIQVRGRGRDCCCYEFPNGSEIGFSGCESNYTSQAIKSKQNAVLNQCYELGRKI